ncbi:unnamed protein product [Rhizoctonia solani]|uniref:Protein kinase domain-containing protein n=1 Tax=Rhizoctonia solani TaxID=456999 RepID=A0A8H3CAI0_9AGAM|nr:unnamed protein product [Rhizoctonia solani]
MESLLKWSLENTPADEPVTPPTAERMKELDPAIIDMILGKSDAVVMKVCEKLAIARDESREEDERVEALDDFEMLVEQIDNANNLENLKMWEPLIELIRSPVPGVQRHAIWIAGTAVQNNSAAQSDFLKRDPLPHLLSLVTSYQVSGIRRLDELDGWKALKHALQDPDITVRRKTAFLINTLLLQDASSSGSTAAALHESDGPKLHSSGGAVSESTEGLVRRAIVEHGLIEALVQPLPYGLDGDGDPMEDADYREKVLQTIDTFVQNGGKVIVGPALNDDMDPEGSQGRRPASTAVERTRRASGSNKGSGMDVSQHPAAIAYQAAHPRRAIPRFGPYLLLQTLGEGEFGKVKLGLHATWGEEVAVKLIRRGNVENALRMSKVEREIEVLRKINHPNIVRLYDVIETDKYIGIVLEYASGGELFDHILAHRFLRERDACKLFAQLISGVSYIHQKKIVHRDLKLENLLLDRNRNVIITDFGFANRFEHRPDDLMQTSCGSPCYAAPELVISEGEYVGSAVDIWSCGVILYAMLAGYLPFDDDPANPDGDNINLLYKYIVTTPLTFPDYVSEAARDLLGRMLVPDPKHRADLVTIMAHPWLEPYSAQFQLSVEQLEQQATEQQHAKRMAYQRQIRKKQQQQAQAAQTSSQSRATRTQSTRPAAPEDSTDLLYTSTASPSRRERAGASAIVLPSPTNAANSEMLTVDGAQTQDSAPGERKNRGYRHTIQLEYDVGTRDSAPPVPTISPVPLEASSGTPSSITAMQDTSTGTTTPTPEHSQPQSSTNGRSVSTSRVAPPSAFSMSTGVRSVSAGTAETRARSEETETMDRAISSGTGRGGSMDANGRSLDFSMSEDGAPFHVPRPGIPSVQVSQPSTSIDEADILAALTGGKRSVKHSTTSTNGVNGANGSVPTPSVKVDMTTAGEIVRSPVMLTPTTIESTGLPTRAPTEPAVSDAENKPRPAPAQTKPTDSGTSTPTKTPEPVLAPTPAGPVRNVSTSSTGGSSTPRSKSTRQSTKPVEKPAEEEVGNTSVSSSKSRRKTLSLMVEPFQRPFRTRTPVEPQPERKDTQPQPLRSAPVAPPTVAPAPVATPAVAQEASPAPATYKSNTERFMAEGAPAGPASATSKAKRVMNWFRKRSLAPEVATPASHPVVSLPPANTPLAQAVPTRSDTQPHLEPKHSSGMDSLSTTKDQSSLQLPRPSNSPTPVSIVKPSKPIVNRAGMRVHEGAVDQAMVTSGSPLDALSHAEAVLVEMGIAFTKESEWKFRCVRHKKRKGGISGSVGGLSAGVMGSAASGGVNNRGLPMPPPPSFGGAGGMLRGLLRRSSAQPGVPVESEGATQQQQLPEPIYGERTDDAQDEVRFFVELTRIDRLEYTYSIDDKMSTATPTRKPLPGYYQFGAGAFAGVTEICIFYPLDVVKTRMQLDTGKSPSMLTSFKNIIREEGAGRLYRGLVPPLLLEAPKRAVKFAANDFWGKAFVKNSPDGKMTQGLSILTGAAAGATESFVVVPFELVKIRLQDKTSKYAGPMDVVRSIVRQHGPLGLYAGMESTFWRFTRMVEWWLFWTISETTDRFSAGYGIGDPNELDRTIYTLRSKLPKAETPQAALLNNFVSGAAGGFVGTALNTPFDVVKSRIQGAHPVPGVLPKYNWTYPSLALILREEGAAALYKGFVPKVLRLAPGGGVLLLVVEAVLGVVRKTLGPPYV